MVIFDRHQSTAYIAPVTAIALIIFALLVPATGSAGTWMPCGTAPHYDQYPLEYDDGDLRYLQRPRNCTYSIDGTVAGTIRLANLRWRSWGGKRAVARGAIVDNHDQDNNGFQRHPVRIVLANRLPAYRANRRKTGPARYYTKLILIRFDPRRKYVIQLYRRGAPVTL